MLPTCSGCTCRNVAVVCCVVFTGFGYRTPSDDGSRLFTIFAMIFGVFVVFGGISTALTHRLAAFKAKRRYHDLDRVEEIHKDLYRRLLVNAVAIVVALFVAALLFYTMERWSFIRSLYFAVQTATVRPSRCCLLCTSYYLTTTRFHSERRIR
jgi:magnesium-transporting ATPase (P-type)